MRRHLSDAQKFRKHVSFEKWLPDANGILQELIAVPTEMKLNISSLNANPNKGNKTNTVLLGVDVKNAVELEHLMTRLKQVKDVYKVSRAMGSQGL